MDSSHAFDFPLDDFAPTQHAALDAALTRESIAHEWHGSTLSVDVAYEARVTTLIDQARNEVLPSAPPLTAAQPTAPTAPMAPTMPGVATTPGGPAPSPYPAGAPGYGYGAGYGYGTAYGYGYTPSPPTNGLATASLVLGIVSLVLCGFFTGVPALICGLMARRRIRDSNGAQGGEGLALAGMIMGGIATALAAIVVIFYVVIIIFALAAGSTG